MPDNFPADFNPPETPFPLGPELEGTVDAAPGVNKGNRVYNN